MTKKIFGHATRCELWASLFGIFDFLLTCPKLKISFWLKSNYNLINDSMNNYFARLRKEDGSYLPAKDLKNWDSEREGRVISSKPK